MTTSDFKCNVPMTRLQRLSEVTAPPQEWLWLKVIPRGALTMITGAEGIGKSLLITDFAATVTRGDRGPHGSSASEPGAVLLASQGRLDMTARCRLEAAGADLSLVYALEFGPDPDGIRAHPRYRWLIS